MRLVAVGVATAGLYGAWVAWVPLLPSNLYVPLLDLGKITGYTWPSTIRFLALVGGLYALYALGYRLALRPGASSKTIFAFGGLFCFALLWAYPATAVDVFGYVAHGRVLALHGANPFVAVPFAFPTDPILPYLAYPSEPSQYGPAWVLLGAGLASIAARFPDPLLAEVIGYKLVAASAHLVSAALVLHIARRLGADAARARGCAFLFLWNPTLLWEVVGNAHNDGVMMLGGLLAAALFTQPRASMLVLPMLAVGALIKLPVAVLVPLFFVAELRRRWLLALEGAVLAAVLVVVVYRPFWQGPDTLTALRRTDLFTASLGSIVRLALEPTVGLEIASTLARWLSQGAFGLIVGACVVLAVRAQKPKHVVSLAYVTMLAAVLLATTWFQAWYVVWPFALAAALPESRRHLEVALLALGGLLQYAVFVYLWVMAVLPPAEELVIQGAAYGALMLPLVLGVALLAFSRRARYAL